MWALGALGLLALALVGAVFWLATWLDRTATPPAPPAPPRARREAMARHRTIAMEQRATASGGALAEERPRRPRSRIEWMVLAADRAVLGRVVAGTLPEALAAARERWGPLCHRVQSRVSWEIAQGEARTMRRDRVIRE